MKAENLKCLSNSGICVPPFQVVLFDEAVCGQEALQEKLSSFKWESSPDLDLWSGELQECLKKNFCVRNLRLPAGSRFAVRSSCSLEDGEDYSFAGIFESFLDVEREEVSEKLLSCLQSLYSRKALEYILLKGIDIAALKMDVILQEMVAADISGILFTANPQGILNESVITVGRGRGDLVVSDGIETTSYFYHQTDKSYHSDRESGPLSSDWLEEILETGEKIKEILSLDYADIEFAIAGDKLHILQARPITGLEGGEYIVLDNSNIVESYPGISLPLTDSFARMIYQGVFRGVARRVLRDERKVQEMESVFSHMVDSVNGRMFYRIDNWYKILRFLPMSRKIIPVWQEMLGVRNRQYEEKGKEQPRHRQLITALCFLGELLRVPSSMQRLNDRFSEVSALFQEKEVGNLSNEEWKSVFFEIRGRLLSVWDITLINDMYAFLFTGLLKKILKKKDPEQFEERTLDLISGISHIESMKPMQAIIDLALLRKKEGDSPAYREAFDRYVQNYGDRTMEELKLETKTFRTNPELLDQKIQEYLLDEEKLQQMEKELGKTPKLFEEKGIAGFFAKRATVGILNREISRLNRCRIFGMVRRIFLSMAENLCREGCLDQQRDIFYLRLEEVFEFIENPKDLRSLVESRKEEYGEYLKLPSCSRLILKDEQAKAHYRRLSKYRRQRKKDRWQGTACSGGVVSGEVALVQRPEDALRAKDKIIVAKMTDPGWVFVLANARGIITEKGSLLSHTAIISRELGIPAVVGVDDITEMLREGDLVSLDGNKGEVRKVEKDWSSQG